VENGIADLKSFINDDGGGGRVEVGATMKRYRKHYCW
jgi:hypothetical protein